MNKRTMNIRVGMTDALGLLAAGLTVATLGACGASPDDDSSGAGNLPEESLMSESTADETSAALPPGQCTRHCGTCAADPESTTGCSKVCRTGECDVDVVECPATACSAPTACPSGSTRCGAVCRDLASDPNHCGACGRSCGAGGRCEHGVCYPTPEVCDACTNGSQTCCHNASSDQRLCGVRPCLSACEAGAVCAPSGSGDTCACAAGQTCARRCGPDICEVNWALCAIVPFPLCLIPQCSPGLCTIDSFCQ